MIVISRSTRPVSEDDLLVATRPQRQDPNGWQRRHGSDRAHRCNPFHLGACKIRATTKEHRAWMAQLGVLAHGRWFGEKHAALPRSCFAVAGGAPPAPFRQPWAALGRHVHLTRLSSPGRRVRAIPIQPIDMNRWQSLSLPGTGYEPRPPRHRPESPAEAFARN